MALIAGSVVAGVLLALNIVLEIDSQRNLNACAYLLVSLLVAGAAPAAVGAWLAQSTAGSGAGASQRLRTAAGWMLVAGTVIAVVLLETDVYF
ncbi:hypothetical protein AB0K00_31095 [Dactylosporangium sp. NPDC049525]|uniref:hypothetical protein n=1 Tax=Dactylosporangium sp. NPDC049525 TaxID=3154730 RepID=UPI00342B08DF